jgi:hypothetical protein
LDDHQFGYITNWKAKASAIHKQEIPKVDWKEQETNFLKKNH